MQVFSPDIESLLGSTPAGRDTAMGGAYEGASQFDRAVALWAPALQSADNEIMPDKDIADARVRDLARNEGPVQSVGQFQRDSIVGAAFYLTAKPEWKHLKLSEKWAREHQEEVETKFTLAAESPNNWFDAARRNTFTEMVRLVVGTYLLGGEVLATCEYIRQEARPFKTAIQLIEADRLRNPWDMAVLDNPRIRGGVEMDTWGAPIAYHIRLAHPTDPWAWNSGGYETRRVPTRKPWGRLQVIHIAEQMRIDQTRGISEVVATLKEMKIGKKLRDITLQQLVLNASYATSIESDLPTGEAFAALAGSTDGTFGDGAMAYAQQYLAAIAQYAGSGRNMRIDGVKIPHFFPGTRLKVQNLGFTPGGVGSDFETSLKRHMAASLGMSYEEFSRDYSKANYSSIKAGLRQTERYLSARKKMVADRFASIVYQLWYEEQINSNGFETITARMPNFYEGLNKEAYTYCEWVGASKGQIDELKETQAAILRLKANLTTYEEEHARLGKDWREVFAQRELESKEMKDRGLVLEEDNSVNAASGDPREKGNSNADE